MKFLKWIITILGTMFAGMYGGQKNKSVRRFGIPIPAFLGALGDGFDFRDLSFLLFIPILCMGYGENSFLMGWFGQDWLVRVVYGLCLSLPFFFHGLRRGAFAAVILPIVFIIQADSLGSISWFGDILIEDIIRYGTLGILIAFNLFVKKGE